MSLPHFDQLVFSGGGLRCFWQGGFLDEVRDVLPLEPQRIAGVSGGALSAVGFVTRRSHKVLQTMVEALAETDSNIAWNTPEDDGLTPHQRLYREVLEEVIDAEAEATVADGPSLQILIGHPPSESWPKLSGMLASAAYEAELHSVSGPHFGWAESLGVTTTLVDAREAARAGQLAELVIAAAVIPPIFEPPVWDGRPVIDGGMADQAPMPHPDCGETLILLTRHYRAVPEIAGRWYLEPIEECPVDKIDFTDPDAIRAAWACGRTDGQRFLQEHGLT